MKRLSNLFGSTEKNKKVAPKSSPTSRTPKLTSTGAVSRDQSSKDYSSRLVKGFGIFPFVNGAEERAVLAFSHLHGNEHVPPMLVRLLTFMRSSLQGKRVETVGGKGISSPSAVCTLADGRTLIAAASPEGPALFSPGGAFIEFLGKAKKDFRGCNGVCQLDSGSIVVTDSANGRLQLFALGKDQSAPSIPCWVSNFDLENASTPATAHLGKVVQVEPEVVAILNTSTSNITLVDCRDLDCPTLVKEFKIEGASDLVFLERTQSYAVLQGIEEKITLLDAAWDSLGTITKLTFTSEAFETSWHSNTENKFLKTPTFSYPSGLATTKDGKLVVADQGNKRLLVYDVEEKLVTKVIDTATTSKEDGERFGSILAVSGIGVVPQTGGIVIADKIGQKIHYFV